MNNRVRIALTAFFFSAFLFTSFCGYAEDSTTENKKVSVTVMPVRFTAVKGDVAKWRAYHWMTDGYVGGLKNLSFEDEVSNDTTVSFEGHALSRDEDIGADFMINKDDFGEFHLDYSSFRKYYDNSGGTYSNFSTYPTSTLSRDLDMDIGHFLVEFTPMLPSFHDITLSYERHTKNGAKSRLTWSEVEESVTRNIYPVFQDINETVDTFTLAGNTTLAGFDVSAEQKFETTESTNLRVEKDISTTGDAADKLMRFHYQDPNSEVITSTLQGDKWFNQDNSFFSMGYRYQLLENGELENIVETDADGVRDNVSSNPEQIVNAYAQNRMNSHIWTGQYMHKFSPALSFSTKGRTELMQRDGEARYPADNTGPDYTIDDGEINDTRNALLRWGENFSLRYTGIQRATIFADVDLSQAKNNLREQQFDLIAGTRIWNRDTQSFVASQQYSLGSRVILASNLNLTARFKYSQESNDYEHKEKNPTSGINSAFFNFLGQRSYEPSLNLVWKTTKRITNSFRYQLRDTRYESRIETETSTLAWMISHIFTYDLFIQPFDSLLLNLGVSNDNSKTSTGAAYSTSQTTPGFNSDVQTAFLSMSYYPTETISYNGSFLYSQANNFNDFLSTGLPLGADYRRMEGTVGLKIKPKKSDVSIEPHYSYYNYDSGSVAEQGGDYSAHVGWLEVSCPF